MKRLQVHPNQMEPPPEAITDPDGWDLMRLWAAHGQLHVALSSEMGGGAEDFGELMADLFEHASRLYAQRDERPVDECRDVILEDFFRRTDKPKGSLTGGMPTDH